MFLSNKLFQLNLYFSDFSESVLTKFVTKDGIGLVIKTMSQYPDHIPIQEHGCRIIGNVAVHGMSELKNCQL